MTRKSQRLAELATYCPFPGTCQRDQTQTAGVPDQRKAVGKTIVGYGAPGKGNTLLNYCGIRTDFIDFTVDRNPLKQGNYTPGTHIPILAPEAIRQARPDYIFILPWNLKEEISASMRFVRDLGRRSSWYRRGHGRSVRGRIPLSVCRPPFVSLGDAGCS